MFLNDQEVAKRYGVHRKTIWEWARKVEDFPKPIKLVPRTTRWSLADLDEFDEKRRREAQVA